MSLAVTASSSPNSTRQAPLRVMVVDDSVVIRGLISRWIESEPTWRWWRRCAPASMPSTRSSASIPILRCSISKCRSLTAFPRLPKLLAKKRDLIVIMASTLTRRNAEISFKGAVARRIGLYPQAGEHARSRCGRSFPPRSHSEDSRPSAPRSAAPRRRCMSHRHWRPRTANPKKPLVRRRPLRPVARFSGRAGRRPCTGALSQQAPRVLLVGSSTGGPQALMALVADLGPGDRPLPGADHAAHAADFHDDSGGTSCSRQPPAGALRRSMARQSSRA